MVPIFKSKKKKGKIVKKVIPKYNQPLTLAEAIVEATTLRSDSSVKRKPRRVAINLTQLRKRCLASIDDFMGEGEVTDTKDGMYIYIDNGADILAVAHLDTVRSMKHFHRIDLGGEPVVFNAQLDDRLGAYIILDMLPQYGLKYDILLTEGEESARSTGQWFETEKEYKWMFQFDRSGTDVVMYQYEDKHMRKLLYQHGFHTGFGSFSDISMMDDLGCKGFNFGCGYYDNHTRMGHVMLREACTMIARFMDFYEDLKDTHLEHEYDEMDQYYDSYGYSYRSAYGDGYGYAGQDKEDWYSGKYNRQAGWESDCPFCYRSLSECDDDLCREAKHNVMSFGAREWRDKCDYCDADVGSEDEYWMTGQGDLLCYDCASMMDEEFGDTFQLTGFNMIRYEKLEGGH